MKTVTYVLIVVALIVGGYFFITHSIDNPVNEQEGQWATKTDQEIGFQFEYRDEPNGYLLTDLNWDASTQLPDPRFVKGYQLILKSDYESYAQIEGAHEGPPNITVAVFENQFNQSASMWVDANPIFSQIQVARTEPDRDAVVGGTNAMRYLADGLYLNDVVIVAHGGRIYMFSGAYLEEGSQIQRDFQPFLDSAKFVPTI